MDLSVFGGAAFSVATRCAFSSDPQIDDFSHSELDLDWNARAGRSAVRPTGVRYLRRHDRQQPQPTRNLYYNADKNTAYARHGSVKTETSIDPKVYWLDVVPMELARIL